MRKFLQKHLPTVETIKGNRWLRPFGTWLHHPNLWHLHRRSVAGGVAIGLFCGLIPGPLQMLGALFLAVLFRVNLPVAFFVTLYTNPFTIAPLYLLAYQLGILVTGQQHDAPTMHFALPQMGWSNWHAAMLDFASSFGKPLAVGLPLLALILALVGYFAVRLLWFVKVKWEWRRRRAQHKKSSHTKP